MKTQFTQWGPNNRYQPQPSNTNFNVGGSGIVAPGVINVGIGVQHKISDTVTLNATAMTTRHVPSQKGSNTYTAEARIHF